MKKVVLAATRAGLTGLSLLVWLGVAVAAMVATTIGVATVFGCPFGVFELAVWWAFVLVLWAGCTLGHLRTEAWAMGWAEGWRK